MTKTILKVYILPLVSFILMPLILIACFPPQPHNIQNVCNIFEQYPTWYWDAKRTEAKWGVPVQTQMAIIYQESGFQATAEPPPKGHYLNQLDARPETTALGYCQALNGSWDCYQKSTGRQNASRDQFAAASDFIGWYSQMARRIANINPADTYNLYLAYHEGIGGFRSHSYLHKPWLIQVAHRVESHALTYAQQLQACEGNIPKPSLYQPGR